MRGILNGLDYEKSLHACVTTPFFRTRKKHGSIFVSWSFLQTLSSFIRSTAFFFSSGDFPPFWETLSLSQKTSQRPTPASPKRPGCQNQSQCALGYFSQQPSLIRTLGVVVWVVLFTSWKMCCLACVFRRVGTKKSGMTHAAWCNHVTLF